MNLPNIASALVERVKVAGYLLASDHSEGAGKAAFFIRFGFEYDSWTILAGTLLAHARTNPVAFVSETRHGSKYRIDGPMICPDGRSPSIRAIWIIDSGTDVPRLVTAYPI